LLGEGVAASTRSDPQAKSLGEYLRAKVLDIPQEIVASLCAPDAREAGPAPPAPGTA
jgi:hypothetical protein